MTTIHLETNINAPIERVFNLARSIDLHQYSNQNSKEKAIAGRTTGLIELGETVTWRAKHFGIYQTLTVKIIQFEEPTMFEDQMQSGAFKRMYHTHRFIESSSGTTMIDDFHFESPLGILGKLVDILILKQYMTQFLIDKNSILKSIGEGEDWKNILS